MHEQSDASAWMREHAALIVAGSRVLDVACGRGRHARYLAGLGARVTAVDRDVEALAALAGVPNVQVEVHDLEGAPWPYRDASFDAVVVCNYLWRASQDALLGTLRPGGVLLYETFMIGNEAYGKPSRPDFLLRSNELLAWTGERFDIVAFRQGPERDASGRIVAVKQKIAAIKRSG